MESQIHLGSTARNFTFHFTRTRSASIRRAGSLSWQANLPGEQLVHHALLEGTGFGELGFQFGDFGVHVGEDGGDGGLLGNRWQLKLYFSEVR